MSWITKTFQKTANAISKTWNWFNGKKTVIGTVCLLASKYFPQHTLTYQITSTLGELLGYGGMVHKAVKNKDKLPSGITNITSKLTKKEQ